MSHLRVLVQYWRVRNQLLWQLQEKLAQQFLSTAEIRLGVYTEFRFVVASDILENWDGECIIPD